MGQRVATNSLIESIQGQSVRPVITTSALNPSPGSLINAPPDVTRLVGVDYQTVTVTVNFVSGTIVTVNWQAVGFPGLLSTAQRYYAPNAQTNTASFGVNTVQSINNLYAGQSTQLLLLCTTQQITNKSTGLISTINYVTRAFQNGINTTVLGPWFPTGLKYAAFSAIPTAEVYCTASTSNVALTLGVSAQLYAVFVQ